MIDVSIDVGNDSKMPNTYSVTIPETPEGPDAATRERLAQVAAFRLRRLEERDGHYPQSGEAFDMLDHFSGRFFWERTDEEMVNDPPSRVEYEVLTVDPPDMPEVPGNVSVTVRLVF